MYNIILGPPGTGKTTKLLATAKDFMKKGVPPDRIGFFTFSRRGAFEGRERAMKQFNLMHSDLPFFRTIHSLAYDRLGINSQDMMEGENYLDFLDVVKIPQGKRSMGSVMKDGPFIDPCYNHEYLELINMARIRGESLQYRYNHSNVGMTLPCDKLLYTAAAYEQFKRDERKFDYTDLLELFVKKDIAPRLELLLIDEAQDLSDIQWKIVESLAVKAENIYIAGDDDQAVYQWAGASVEKFINLKGSVEVLGQSWRIPQSHHKISQAVAQRIKNRRPKEFNPRLEKGRVAHHEHFEGVIDKVKGSVLCLARTRRDLTYMEDRVKEYGLNYIRSGNQPQVADQIKGIKAWEKLREGGEVTGDEAFLVTNLMNTDHRANREKGQVEINYGARSLVKQFATVDLAFMKEQCGLRHDRPWTDCMFKIKDSDRFYYKRVLKRGFVDEVPRITISTIHAAKGAEADTVILNTDTARVKKPYWSRELDPSGEERVLYVALTRAKETMYLIHPKRKDPYCIPGGT